MTIKPSSISFWGVMSILFAGDLFLFFAYSQSDSIIGPFSLIVPALLVNVLLATFLLLEYKTFTLNEDTLSIRPTYFKFLKPFTVDIKEIEGVRVIRYSIQNKISPVMIVSFSDHIRKDKKIKFRMEDKRVEFQDFLKLWRTQGTTIVCEGDVWF
ncbi:hypothetical protein B0I18_1071 [Taibaiella chishuiensis]|uniref:Uncharacterized protein n=2 Tax=Taibaiella chishuiensis TaxID=1434707 RepID=A0A2P8D045_9BACT|nr:hypothetical protein B0I18_1071 [Taibaiella chishuiensis]